MGNRTTQTTQGDRPPRRAPDLAVAVLGVAGVGALLAAHLAVEAALFVAAFAVAVGLVPVVRRAVARRGVVGLPGGRAIHLDATPLLGGLGLFVPVVVVAILLAVGGDHKALGIAAGATAVFACGAFDDVWGVRPRAKVLCQLVAGGCLVVAGFRLPALSVAGLGALPLGSLEIPAILLWVVVASNAFNLSDGLDGLAGLLALVGCAGAVALGAQPLLAVALAGACLGFLRHNLPRATIFLGDSGSLVVGFLLAAFALEVPASSTLPLAYGLLAYSLGDMALAVFRRSLRGKPLFAGDRSHVHHKLAELFDTTWSALAAAVAFAVVHLVLVLTVPGVLALTIVTMLWAALAAVLMIAGRVRLVSLLASRGPFRRIHLVKRYVSGRLRYADGLAEIEFSLRRLVEDLGLAHLAFDALRIEGISPGPAVAATVEVAVPLRTGRALFGYAPTEGGRVVDDELHTVVCAVLREADDRWSSLAGVRPGDTTRGPFLPGLASPPGLAPLPDLAPLPGLASPPGLASLPGLASPPGRPSVAPLGVFDRSSAPPPRRWLP